jgi:hypothetical protein
MPLLRRCAGAGPGRVKEALSPACWGLVAESKLGVMTVVRSRTSTRWVGPAFLTSGWSQGEATIKKENQSIERGSVRYGDESKREERIRLALLPASVYLPGEEGKLARTFLFARSRRQCLSTPNLFPMLGPLVHRGSWGVRTPPHSD